MEKVNAKRAAEMVRAAYKIRRPLMLWGPPGTAKSATVAQVAREDGLEFIDLRLVQIDALDLRGMPRVRMDTEGNELMHFVPTAMLPRHGKGILFLDEFVQAPTLVQNSASELILDRRVGEYKLPDGWGIIVASNRRSDRAGTLEMPAHLKNRVIHVEVIAGEAKGWLEWAAGNDIHPAVIKYIQSNPGDLYKFSADEYAYPTLRTWEYASDVLKSGVKGPILRALLIGCIGEAVGTQLLTWIETSVELPSYEDVVSDPVNVPIPTKAALMMKLTDIVLGDAHPKHAAEVVKFFDRIVERNSDLKGYIAVNLIGSKGAFAQLPLVKEWVKENTQK